MPRVPIMTIFPVSDMKHYKEFAISKVQALKY